MDSKELKEIMEAYSEVYAPQEVDEATAMAKRGYDETKLRQRAGGGEAADRASALENKPTFGDAKKAKQRQDYARKQRGDFRKTASSNPGLHVGGHKSNDPKVKAIQAARGAQRGALTPDERKQLNMGDESFDLFDTILEFLCVEGYAETFEDAEWMMANIIDDEAIDIILGEEQLDEISLKTKMSAFKKRATHDFESDGDSDNYTKSGENKTDKIKANIVKKHGEKAGQHAERAAHTGIFGRKSFSMPKKPEKTRKEEFEVWLDEAMSSYERNRKRAAARAEARNAARDAGKTGVVPGVGYVSPRREKISLRDKFGTEAGIRMAKAKPPSGDEKH
jgi:hypothetical protein